MRKLVATVSVVFYVLVGFGLSLLQVPFGDLAYRLTYTYRPGFGLGFGWVAYLPLAVTLLLGLACLAMVSACQDEDRLESFGTGLFVALIMAFVGWVAFLWLVGILGMDIWRTELWDLAWLYTVGLAVISGLLAYYVPDGKARVNDHGDEFVTRKQVEEIVDRKLGKKKRR